MKPKTAIVLTILLVAVMILVIVRHTDWFVSAPVPARPVQKLWPVPLDAPVALTIVSTDGTPLRFEYEGDSWHLTKPIQAKAKSYAVNRIVDAVRDPRPTRSFASDDDERPDDDLTGLDHPRWVVRLGDAQGNVRALNVGRTVPLSGGKQTYVRPADSKVVCVLDVDFAEMLSASLEDFRDKTILALPRDHIEQIVLEGRHRIQLIKTDHHWGIVEPIAAEADQAVVDKLLNKIATVTAEGFVNEPTENLSVYGLEPGRERLVVRVVVAAETETALPETTPTTQPIKSSKTYTLAMGNETQENRYAFLPGSPDVFLVPTKLLEELQPSLLLLREKTVLPIQTENVLRIELDSPDGRTELEKQEESWQMIQPFAGPANSQAVRELLGNINGLKAQNFRDDVADVSVFGLDAPRARITIHSAGVRDKQELFLGSQSPSGEVTFCKLQSREAVAVVKTADIQRLLVNPAGYWNTTLFGLSDLGDLCGLEIQRRDALFVLEKTDEGWQLTSPLAASVDSDNLNKILDPLEQLQANKIVTLGEPVPDLFAQAAEQMTFRFRIRSIQAGEPATVAVSQPAPQSIPPEPEMRTWVLHVARMGRNAYAWVEGQSPQAIGKFDASLFKTLHAELRERKIWQLPPEQITAIDLQAGPVSCHLQKQGERWKYTPDPYVRIDAEKVKTFLEDIAEIRLDRFVTHTEPDTETLEKYGLDKPWFTLALADDEQQSWRITVSHKGAESLVNRYAVVTGLPGVMLLDSDTAGKLARKLEDFKD